MTLLELKKDLKKILLKQGIKKAAVFGSYARGDNNEKSDIDLLVDLQGSKSLLDLVALKYILEDRFNKKFDVITYNALNPLLKDKIISEQQQII